MKLKLYKTLTGHNSSIYKIIPYDKSSFLSLGGDGFLVHWDIKEENGKLIARSEDKFFSGCKISDHIYVTGAFSGQIYWFNVSEKTIVKRVQHHKKSVFACVMHGEFLYTISEDGCLTLWDCDLMSPVSTFQISPYGLRSIEIIDKDFLIIGDMNGTLYYVDYSSFKIIDSWKAHGKSIFSIYKSEDILYTGGRDAMLKKWNLKTQNLIHELPAHWYTINDIKVFNDMIITASRDKKIRVWDKDMFLLQSIDVQNGGHINSVNSIAVLQTFNMIISCSDDRTIKIWNL
jgi:WD40 repeat protein